MKISEKVANKRSVCFIGLTIGSVFRGSLEDFGLVRVFIKTTDGTLVDVKTGIVYRHPKDKIYNYTPYPTAVLVLEP